MNNLKTVLILELLFIYYICHGLSKNIPSFIHVCKRSDPELSNCIINVFKDIRPRLIKGIPEMDIPPGDPFYYPNMTYPISETITTILVSKAYSWNQVATGLLDFNITHLDLDLDQARCSITLSFPLVRLQGNYEFKGKILFFELDTTGTFDMNSTDIVAHAEFYGKFYTKKEKQHIEFEKVTLDIQHVNVAIYLNNLVNGNELLTQTVNLAINDNIETITKGTLPVIGAILGKIGRDYFNAVFRLFSVDQLFPRN